MIDQRELIDQKQKKTNPIIKMTARITKHLRNIPSHFIGMDSSNLNEFFLFFNFILVPMEGIFNI